MTTLRRGLQTNDVKAVAAFLASHLGFLEGQATDGGCSLDHLCGWANTPEMVDLLLEQGLTTSRISEAWAAGFGLNETSSEVAEHLIVRGVRVTPHAAAALGLVKRLREQLDRQPELVHAKGGDGGRPLHFARNLETAQLLVERGAELDVRDDDHNSTPAQWRIKDAPEVTHFLLKQGAQADIFMAAGLGDLELARKQIEANPQCTTFRIGNNRGPFPGIGFQHRGGTIYQWTLGFNQSPQEIARDRGHRDVFQYLMNQTPPRQRLLVDCMTVDALSARSLLA